MGRAATAKAGSSLAGPAAKTPQTKSGVTSAIGSVAAKDKGRSRAGQCPNVPPPAPVRPAPSGSPRALTVSMCVLIEVFCSLRRC